MTATPDQPAGWFSDGTSDDDRLRWQTRATYLQLDLVHRSRRDHLPAVAWTIGPAGTLTLRCTTRAEWQTWVRALEHLDVLREKGAHGFRHLHAVGQLQAADGAMVTVAVIADIDLSVPAENTPALPRPRHPGDQQ